MEIPLNNYITEEYSDYSAPDSAPKIKKPCKSLDLQGFTFQDSGPTRART